MDRNEDFGVIARSNKVNKSWVDSQGMVSTIEGKDAVVLYKVDEKIYSTKVPVEGKTKINVGELMDVEYDRLNPEISNASIHPRKKVDTEEIDSLYFWEGHYNLDGSKHQFLTTFEELVQYNKEIDSRIRRRGYSLTTRGTIVVEEEDSFVVEFYVGEKRSKKQFMKQEGESYYYGKPVLLSYAIIDPEFVVILPDSSLEAQVEKEENIEKIKEIFADREEKKTGKQSVYRKKEQNHVYGFNASKYDLSDKKYELPDSNYVSSSDYDTTNNYESTNEYTGSGYASRLYEEELKRQKREALIKKVWTIIIVLLIIGVMFGYKYIGL